MEYWLLNVPVVANFTFMVKANPDKRYMQKKDVGYSQSE